MESLSIYDIKMAQALGRQGPVYTKDNTTATDHAGSQCISSCNIDLVIQEYSTFSTRMVETKMFSTKKVYQFIILEMKDICNFTIIFKNVTAKLSEKWA